MDIYAIALGVLIAVFIIIVFKKWKQERLIWIYSLFLATFPIYYWIFALYVKDFPVLINEIIVGLIFIGISIISMLCRGKLCATLLSSGYVLHAGYDFYHHYFFLNMGTPHWWPEFCGSLDFVVAIYLIYVIVFTTKTVGNFASNNRNIT